VVSNQAVKSPRALLILPLTGLLLFAVGTFSSFRFNADLTARNQSYKKYFYWSSIRLDRDPLNRNPIAVRQCSPEDSDCRDWEQISVWVDPGWLAKVLMVSALPAFFIGRTLAVLLGRAGVSQLTTFIISVTVLMFIWYYFLGWIVHRLFARLRTRNA
jgi:hypothetical protein